MPNYGVGNFALQVDFDIGAVSAGGMAVYGIVPNVGPVAGGQAVQVNGRRFENIVSVILKGVPLTSLVVVDSETITGVTGANTPGVGDLQVNSSSVGSATLGSAYTYVGGFGNGLNTLLIGKQIDPTFYRQQYFTGETAPLFVDTTLALTLADIPLHDQSVELYVRRVGQDGGRLMRQGIGFAYTVDMANRKLIWRSTAPFALVPGDELAVCYIGRGEYP